jgi:hypothetical protein
MVRADEPLDRQQDVASILHRGGESATSQRQQPD